MAKTLFLLEPALQDALRSLVRSGMSWQRARGMVAAIEILEWLFQGCEKVPRSWLLGAFFWLEWLFQTFCARLSCLIGLVKAHRNVAHLR